MAKKPTPLAGEATTANYGWTKPTVGASVDAWGGYINSGLDGIDSVVHGIQTSVPAASTTTPAMDGTAAVGTGTTWARADHVHPTDARIIGDNRIINGDMGRDQRNNGASGTANGYTIDRWVYGATQVGKGTWGRNLGGANCAGAGFPYCLGFQSSSAYAMAASDYFVFQQRIEADVISDFVWGLGGALPVTLSFWAICSIAGVFGGSLQNTGATRCYPFSYSLPANVWTKVVITIPGDTSGTWVLSGNNAGLFVNFSLGAGSSFSGPANAWGSANVASVSGAVSVVGTAGATFSITGVKLEIGTVATPFNRQSLAKSMADCQRYFAKTYRQDQVPGQASTDFSALSIFQQVATATSYANVVWTYPVLMRASPTINIYSPHTGAVSKAWAQNGAVDLATVTGQGGDAFCALRLNTQNVAALDFVLFHAIASAEL